ncbi:MAG: Hsp33 family molecular chaperone HslO [Bacilli bacterium]
MDYLLKALICEGRVRVYIAKTTKIINDAINIHDLWPSASSVMGKALTMGVIMGTMLKGQEAVTIKINGSGPIGNVIIDGNAKGEVRGYVDSPHVHFSRQNMLDDEMTLGYNGYLDVIKDLQLKDLFVSSVPLQTGHLAKDFAYYFTKSEQTPSLISLGVTIQEDNTALVNGGFLIQLLPDATEEDIAYLENIPDLYTNFSDLLIKHEKLEDILGKLFDNHFTVLESIDVKYACHCSKDQFARGIATLGKAEIDKIIEEDHQAEIICHYCKTRYVYNEEELQAIKKGITK